MVLEGKTVKKFQITYLISGTRMVEVTVPEGIEVPENVAEMSLAEYDEWLYSVQDSKVQQWEDIDYAEAHKIVRVE
jgi:hypothetical protein